MYVLGLARVAIALLYLLVALCVGTVGLLRSLCLALIRLPKTRARVARFLVGSLALSIPLYVLVRDAILAVLCSMILIEILLLIDKLGRPEGSEVPDRPGDNGEARPNCRE